MRGRKWTLYFIIQSDTVQTCLCWFACKQLTLIRELALRTSEFAWFVICLHYLPSMSWRPKRKKALSQTKKPLPLSLLPSPQALSHLYSPVKSKVNKKDKAQLFHSSYLMSSLKVFELVLFFSQAWVTNFSNSVLCPALSSPLIQNESWGLVNSAVIRFLRELSCKKKKCKKNLRGKKNSVGFALDLHIYSFS